MITITKASVEVDKITGMIKSEVVVENRSDEVQNFEFNQSLPSLNVTQGVGMFSGQAAANGAFTLEGMHDFPCVIKSNQTNLAGVYRFRVGSSGKGIAKGVTNVASFNKEDAIRPYIAHAWKIPPQSVCTLVLMVDVTG